MKLSEIEVTLLLLLLLLLSCFSRVRLCQRWQPTRLPRPWDSPGKNTGVGCHLLFQCIKVKSESEVAQSYPTLRDPMDCSPPGSSIHGIFQARALEWGAKAKVVHQEIPGLTGKFGVGVQSKAGQRLTDICQENSLVIENTLLQQHKRRLYTWTSEE